MPVRTRSRNSKVVNAVMLARQACKTADNHLNRAAARRARLYTAGAGVSRSEAHREIVEAHELLTSALERLGRQVEQPVDVHEVVTISDWDERRR